MSEKLRLAVLLSGTGRTLDNLIEWQRRGDLDAEVVCVASNRMNVRGLEIAREAGIPARAFKMSSYENRESRDAAMAAWALDHGCDLVLLAGYLSLLDLSGFGDVTVLNIHPALLPRHGGEGCWGHHVHEAVLAAGETESGCTVHLVDEEFDRGRILGQKEVPVLPDDEADSLAARVFEAECELYPAIVNQIAHGELAIR